jgi:hypothetical protein
LVKLRQQRRQMGPEAVGAEVVGMRLSEDEMAKLLDTLATEAGREPQAWMPLLQKTIQAVKREYDLEAGLKEPISMYDVFDMMQNCGYTLPIKDDDKPAMRMFGRLMRHYGLARKPEHQYWGHEYWGHETDTSAVRFAQESPLEKKVEPLHPVKTSGPARYVSIAIDCEGLGPKATEAYLKNAELVGAHVRSDNQEDFELISKIMCKAGKVSAFAVTRQIPTDRQYELAISSLNRRNGA